jgi:acetylornithine deacetylase/succinyl-diaminopimelate desuccinylase-like protein
VAVAEDIAGLASIARGSASEGERAAARWARDRLAAAGVEDVALQPYRWPRTHAWAHLPHLAAGFSRRPLVRALALLSYELDQSGRFQWVERLLPKGEGVNVVGRIAARGRPVRTLVLVAHLDTQRAGLMWSRRIMEAGAGRRLRSRSMTPAAGPAAVAIATGSRPPVPGANDNASGVAAVLEVARRLVAEPLEGTDVLVVLPGAEEAGMGGMRAFLGRHGLDPARTFVLGLDTVGSGAPVVAAAEGALLAHGYREVDLDAVDRGARRAGLEPPRRWRIGAYTDPVLARFAGLPAASLLSVGEHGMYTRYHRPDDLPEHVDIACVERCAAIAEGTARELSGA